MWAILAFNLAFHSLISSNTLGFDGFNSSWHLGAVLNTTGDTSYLYTGFLFGHHFNRSNWFYELGGGFAIHDGNQHDGLDERRRMGSRLLFRYEIGLGYRFNTNYALQIVHDHISNAGIIDDDDNQGLDTYGVRLIYYW
ncbi:MAG: acyloxyacyl hydrolase [Pseudomonadota bacterium]